MIKKTIPEQAEKINFNIDGRIMHTGKKVETILLTLLPGEIIPSHTNPFDVLLICIAGNATINAGDQDYKLGPCETLFIGGETMRRIQNLENNALKIMAVKIF
jgi:quercetin dioxygenase-like cupin family protein